MITAEDGAEAWKLLQQPHTPDLLILDWSMPGVDGIEVCRRIREKQRDRYQYILLVPGKDEKQDVVAGLEAGADDYISKPVTSQGIAETIAQVFRGEAQVQVISGSPPLPDAPLIWDRRKALERVDGDEPLLRELVQIFLKESPLQLASLQQAIETANLEEIERIAHTLNGELGCLGMADAAQKAKDLEHLGHERTLQLAADLFPTFEAGVSAVAAAMRDMLDERREPVDL